MKRILISLLTIFSAATLMAQTSIQVKTHNVVALDEQFSLTFVIEGEKSASDFNWSPGDDLELLWGPQTGTSSSISIVNGKRTTSKTSSYTYLLRPIREGTAVIPPATAEVGAKTIRSKPHTIEVVKSGGQSSSQPTSQPSQSSDETPTSQKKSSDLFMRLSLSKTSVVVGEPIVATLKLYQRVNIAGIENVVFPTFNGFWSQEIDAPTNIEFVRETYNNEIFNVALLRRYLLIPQQSGRLTITAAELNCLVNQRVSGGGSSIFDSFFDNYTTIRRKVVSDRMTVNVRALPSPSPASFYGGVGSFDISAKISKDSLKTHEAASLILTIKGKGNISLLTAPKVNFHPDFEVYDTKSSESIERGVAAGVKTYEYPFIPRSAGEFEIPAIEYSYYDISKGKYETISTAPIKLFIAKGAEIDNAGVVMPGIVQKGVQSIGEDIRFIDLKAGYFSKKGAFFLGSAFFYVLVVLVIVLAFVAGFIFRKFAAVKADVVGRKKRKATKMALRRLKQAASFLEQNIYSAFYEELHRALIGFIADKLNLSVGEISKDKIQELLSDAGVEEGIVNEYISLIDACEFARYSPATDSAAMNLHYDSALTVISSIDSDMKSRRNGSGVKLAILALLISLPMGAQNIDSLWISGNEAYTEARWLDAIEDYTAIEDAGYETEALYYNLGNAYFKNNLMAKAILYYERALKFDPSHADARYNLSIANNNIQDRIETVPEFILTSWARKLCYIFDSDAWAISFIVFLALTFALVLLFLLSRSTLYKRIGFFTAIVSFLLSIACLSFSIWQKLDYAKEDSAIIMTHVVSVKSSPSSTSAKDLFILHEGTKVKIIEEIRKWYNIQLADGRQGWVLAEDLEVI